QEAAREPPQAGLRAALAGGERLLPTQAVARLGAARQVGCVPRARVLPPRAHSQPDAPRSHGVEGFNRATNAEKALKRSGGLYRIICSARIGELEGVKGTVPNAEYIVLSVADSGSGIPRNMRDQLFQDRMADGDTFQGLGSRIIRKVIDNHRGL